MSPKDINYITAIIDDKIKALVNEINDLNEENQNLRDIIADLNTELAICQATIDMLHGDKEP